MYGQSNNTLSRADAQGARPASFVKVANQAIDARLATPKPIYKAVCQACYIENNLTTYRRAGGNVVLCLKHGGIK